MELDLAARSASSTLGVHESASSFISLEHLAPDMGRDRPTLVGALLSLGPWSVRKRRLLLSRLGEEGVQRPLEDRGGVAIRDLVAQQVLKLCELVASLLADRDLELVAAGRKGTGPGLWLWGAGEISAMSCSISRMLLCLAR